MLSSKFVNGPCSMHLEWLLCHQSNSLSDSYWRKVKLVGFVVKALKRYGIRYAGIVFRAKRDFKAGANELTR